MKDKYNKLMLDTYDKCFKIKCEMIYLVSILKNNKSSIYKIPVGEYGRVILFSISQNRKKLLFGK